MRSRRNLLPLLVFFLLATAAGCKKKESFAPNVIVQIGQRSITLEQFRRYVARNAGTEPEQIGQEGLSGLLDQLVTEAMLSEYAAKNGIDVTAAELAEEVRRDAATLTEEKRDELRRRKLIAQIAGRAPSPSEAEMKDYYRDHPEEFNTGEQVRVRQILVPDEKTANQVFQRLAKGGVFEDLCKQFSRAPNASKGGDIGWVGRGQLPKVFEDEIFGIRPGQTSKVIEADGRYYIFKVDQVQPAGSVDERAAEALIRSRLSDEWVRNELDRIVRTQRESQKITLLRRRLPFKYGGSLPASDE